MTDRLVNIPADWTFRNREVADGFDSHVREQLPWYDLASGAVAHVARHYLPEDGIVYDIGASTGNIGRLLADSLTARNASLIPLETAPEMLSLYNGPGTPIPEDARTHDYREHDVAVLFLVVMFIPVPDRPALLTRIYDRLRPGGAMVVVDKADETCGYLATILRRLTLAGKVATGTDSDAIIAKELSLAGIQRPLDTRILPGTPEVFFRFGEFTGWVIEKPHAD
jgi:tRNA (cmo5U34)-methyltransferase